MRTSVITRSNGPLVGQQLHQFRSVGCLADLDQGVPEGQAHQLQTVGIVISDDDARNRHLFSRRTRQLFQCELTFDVLVGHVTPQLACIDRNTAQVMP